MDNKLEDLTAVIVTYKTNTDILEMCLKAINLNVKVIIIENSNNFEKTDHIKKYYPNVEIYCSGKNLGMGAGNNFGILKSKTRYVLTLNPDTICSKEFFDNIKIYLNGNIDFSAIGTQYEKNINTPPAYFFDDRKYNKNLSVDINYLQKVDWVVGCSILFDLSKFENKKLFDENYFLFYEETDLCMELKKKNKNVYSSTKLIVDHLGAKGSLDGFDNKISNIKIRNWHLMWSTFYYNKKNFGFSIAILKSLGPLFRSIFKMIYFAFTFNKNEFYKYSFRGFGLLSSIIGMKSWYRID
tara:strand:- start:1945 stop:2835 length:891 start_codon:yes stop_codon:yes gene_type:complete